MEQKELIPYLFRTEYRKIVSVLYRLFGVEHIEIAEDIVSDTFLLATELWGLKGVPENPVGWLYTVAKNKTKNYLTHNALFTQKLSVELNKTSDKTVEIEVDLSKKNIDDSQLAMIFTVCNPCISPESQIALALSLLCGFGIKEIADAFLTTKEVIYKRLQRAKKRLKVEKIRIAEPSLKEIDNRLDNVLRTLYLLFTEGYYSTSQDRVLRMDLCDEAMRLNYLLIENAKTNKPMVNALFSIMCFHSSRFNARVNHNNELVLYKDQDETLWDKDLILMGEHYLNQASQGEKLTKFHIEAAIAFWHTHKHDTIEKWESILQLYNKLLQIEYSPVIALNRTFALAKANGKKAGIIAAEKLDLINDHFYYSLLGDLYTDIDNMKAMQAFQTALLLASSDIDKKLISNYISQLIMKTKDKLKNCT